MKKLLPILLVILTSIIFADEQNIVSKIYLNINGNEHTLPDEMAKELSNFYVDTKDDMAAEQIGKKFDGQYVRRMDLGDDVDKFIYKRIDNETIKIILRIDDNKAKLQQYIVGNPKALVRWSIINRINFDLDVNIKLKIHLENAELFFIIDEAEYTLKRVHLEGSFKDALAHAFNGFQSISQSASLSDFVGDTISVFKFFDNEATTVVAGANHQDEIEALNNSLPMEVIPIYKKKPEPKLILDIKFLHGYYQDNGVFNDDFKNSTPTITNANDLTYAGVSYLHWASAV